MANIIEITEQNNRLDFTGTYSPIVCGNSNYVLKFNFSNAWQNATKKAAIFVVDGNKQFVDFNGNECRVPIMPNAAFVFVSLLSNDGEEQMVTTPIKIRLEPSAGAGDLSEFNQTASYLSKVIGAINSIENGKLSVQKANIAENVSNPNLLINGDFKINQRGQSSYTGMSGYTVDRWRNSGTYVNVNTNGTITVSHFGGWNYCYQRVEDASKFAGKTVTFSVKIKDISYTTGKPVVSINDGVSSTNSAVVTAPGVYSVTKTISENASVLDCRLLLNNTAMASGEISDISATFEWAKLEFGETPTEFHPRLTAEELALCQRYYQTIQNMRIACCLLQSATIDFTFPLNNKLRVNPTIALGNFEIQSISGTTVQGFSYTCFGDSLTSFKLRASLANHGITNNASLSQEYNSAITLDAEIY